MGNWPGWIQWFTQTVSEGEVVTKSSHRDPPDSRAIGQDGFNGSPRQCLKARLLQNPHTGILLIQDFLINCLECSDTKVQPLFRVNTLIVVPSGGCLLCFSYLQFSQNFVTIVKKPGSVLVTSLQQKLMIAFRSWAQTLGAISIYIYIFNFHIQDALLSLSSTFKTFLPSSHLCGAQASHPSGGDLAHSVLGCHPLGGDWFRPVYTK